MLASLLLVLGVFVVTLSLLGRFWVYGQLVVVPDDIDSTVVAQTPPGRDATIFDVTTLSERRTPLKQTVQLVGSPALSEQASADTGRDVVVWSSLTCTDVPTFVCPRFAEGKKAAGAADPGLNSGKVPLSLAVDVTAYDRRTADQVAWKGSFHEADGTRTTPDVPDSGVTVKFPFGTQKRTYQVWEGAVGKNFPATYEGTSTLKGMKVYEFTMKVPPTKTGSIDVPGSVVGSSEPSVTGDQMYSTEKRYQVDPQTGVIINQTVAQDSFVSVAGERRLTTTKGTFAYTDDVVADTVDTWKSLGLALHVIHDVLPVWGTVVGLLLVAAGVLLARRGPVQALARPSRR